MSTPPLTPAEFAAREQLSEWETFTASDGNTSIRMREERSDEELARAVVAAVRGALFEEAADLITHSERLRSLTDDHMGDIEMAAEELRNAARPTPEESS